MEKIFSTKKLRFGYDKESITGKESDRRVKEMLLAISVAINQMNIPKIKEILIDIKIYLEDHLFTFTDEDTIERIYPERDFVKGLEIKNGKIDFVYFESCLRIALKKIERMKPSGYITKKGKELGIKPRKELIESIKENIKNNQKYLKKDVEEDLKMFSVLKLNNKELGIKD